MDEAKADEASIFIVDKRVTALEQAMKEQLEDSGRREEGEQQVKQEKTEANSCVESGGLEEKAEIISSRVTIVPIGTWKDVEDNKVKQSVRELKDWEVEVDKLKQERADLVAETAKHGIIFNDIPVCLDTRQAADQAADSVQEVSNELRSESVEQELHSNVTSAKEKVQHPLFKGREETKIKELLKGSAKYGIPNTLETVNDIYKTLGRAFANPARLLNFKNKILESSPSNTTFH